MFHLFSDECGTEISNLTHNIPVYITSPNYDKGLPYPHNIDCTWYITDSAVGTYIVTIMDFETEYWDIIEFGFGANAMEESRVSVIREWPAPANILIPHMQMWIRFTSNVDVALRGFLLQVERKSEIRKFLFVIYLINDLFINK